MTIHLDRRELLRAGASAAGGLLLSIALPRRLRASPAAPGADQAFRPNAFVGVEPDGAVVIHVPRPEMGQGVRTSLALLVAEELDAEWSRVRLEQADLDPKYGEQYVGGSNTTPESWEPLRQAGAAARAMLVAAAAVRWGVVPESCDTEPGQVVHRASARRVSYGELAGLAARQAVPSQVGCKSPSQYRLLGTRVPGVDVPSIVRGAERFGIDTRVEGQRFAAIARAPTFGARPLAIDDTAARAVPGVVAVVAIDPDPWPDFGENCPKPPHGVAVVATSTWAAFEGCKQLRVRWSDTARGEGSAALRTTAERLSGQAPRRVKLTNGDPAAALARSAKRLEATYELPFQTHAPLEPMNCTVRLADGRCEIWAPTQNPADARRVATLVTNLAASAIAVHPRRMGGSFGRRFYSDFVAEALAVARVAGPTVQVVWTREDDIRHGFHRPGGLHKVRAGLDGEGRVLAWTHFLANASRGDFLRWQLPEGVREFPGAADLGRFDFPAGLVPALELSGSHIASAVPRGQWRAVEDSTNVFVQQCFLDEVAHATGKDPLALRLELLAPERTLPYASEPGYTWNTARLAAVLRLAAEKAGWGTPLPKGRGRGIAGSFANEGYVAHVAEVEVADDGALRVLRVVAAVDCGQAIHLSGVEAQTEGSIVFGLSAALCDEITWVDGRIEQTNFDDYRVLRLDQCPQIEVHVVPGHGTPLGMGEPALPPVAPAVANAVFAACGVRVRRLPIRPGDLALSARRTAT